MSNKLKEITDGWKNLIFPSPEVEALANKRASICADCDKNVANICSSCGCYLPAKLRSKDSTCPLNKWNK